MIRARLKVIEKAKMVKMVNFTLCVFQFKKIT